MDESKYNCSTLSNLITVGDYNPNSGDMMNSKFVIGECVNINIKDSYKTLTNTATVTMPREVIIGGGAINEDGVRDKDILTDANSVFKKGQRITLSVGYNDNTKMLFDGFITSIESKTPFVLHCEDFGWLLKKTAVPSLVTNAKKGAHVTDVMTRLLEGTGIALHPDTAKMDIIIGRVNMEKSTSIGEILEHWKKQYGLLSFIKMYGGKPTLALSRTYFSTNEDKTLIDGEQSNAPVVDYKYNVVKDNLRFSFLDYDTLAVEATALYTNNSKIRATIILNKSYAKQKADYDIAKTNNPSYKGVVPDEFNVINESTISKKQAKEAFKNNLEIKDYTSAMKNVQDRVDLSHYNVRTFHQANVDRATLIRAAKAKFKEISQTGIDGDLTLFGDFGLTAAQMIRLKDDLSPEKNGLYVISEVITSFGVKGYRQKIKIPYKRGN